MNKTIILAVLIAVVIYLISQSTPQKEDFGKWRDMWCDKGNRYRWLGGCI